MNTLNASEYEAGRYGWYFRPSTQMYEFWWGTRNMIALDAMMLEVMPTYIAMEIRASVTVKPELH